MVKEISAYELAAKGIDYKNEFDRLNAEKKELETKLADLKPVTVETPKMKKLNAELKPLQEKLDALTLRLDEINLAIKTKEDAKLAVQSQLDNAEKSIKDASDNLALVEKKIVALKENNDDAKKYLREEVLKTFSDMTIRQQWIDKLTKLLDKSAKASVVSEPDGAYLISNQKFKNAFIYVKANVDGKNFIWIEKVSSDKKSKDKNKMSFINVDSASADAMWLDPTNLLNVIEKLKLSLADEN